MLACKHERSPFKSPICEHLRDAHEPWIEYVKWYIQSGLDAELVCVPCAEKRKQGFHVDVSQICEECFDHLTSEIAYQEKVGGKPGIKVRPEPFSTTLKTRLLPNALGSVIDIAPINHSLRQTKPTLAFRLELGAGNHGVSWPSGKVLQRWSLTLFVRRRRAVALVY